MGMGIVLYDRLASGIRNTERGMKYRSTEQISQSDIPMSTVPRQLVNGQISLCKLDAYLNYTLNASMKGVTHLSRSQADASRSSHVKQTALVNSPKTTER